MSSNAASSATLSALVQQVNTLTTDVASIRTTLQALETRIVSSLNNRESANRLAKQVTSISAEMSGKMSYMTESVQSIEAFNRRSAADISMRMMNLEERITKDSESAQRTQTFVIQLRDAVREMREEFKAATTEPLLAIRRDIQMSSSVALDAKKAAESSGQNTALLVSNIQRTINDRVALQADVAAVGELLDLLIRASPIIPQKQRNTKESALASLRRLASREDKRRLMSGDNIAIEADAAISTIMQLSGRQRQASRPRGLAARFAPPSMPPLESSST